MTDNNSIELPIMTERELEIFNLGRMVGRKDVADSLVLQLTKTRQAHEPHILAKIQRLKESNATKAGAEFGHRVKAQFRSMLGR